MKSIRMLCVSFFAMLCVGLTSCTKVPLPVTQQLPVVEIVAKSTPAVAEVKPEVSKVALTEQFALAKGDSLWKHALSQNVARKDWPKYWGDACKLSQVPCSDSAWRKLRVGHVLTVPRSDEAIAKDQMLITLAKTAETITALTVQVAELEKQVVELKQAVVEKDDSRTRWIAGFGANPC